MEGKWEEEPYRLRKLSSEGLGRGSTQGTHSSLTKAMASQAGNHKGIEPVLRGTAGRLGMRKPCIPVSLSAIRGTICWIEERQLCERMCATGR